MKKKSRMCHSDTPRSMKTAARGTHVQSPAFRLFFEGALKRGLRTCGYFRSRKSRIPSAQTLSEKLDYVVQATGRPESEIVAVAAEKGLAELYRRQVADAYLAGNLDREQAIAELGEEAVEDLDYARHAVEQDVKWGLQDV